MSGRYETSQEEFWAGDFGDQYTGRNQGPRLVAANAVLFAKVLARTVQVRSVIEFGANIGLNLLALRSLLPAAELSAIEINPSAVLGLKAIEGVRVYPQSILAFTPDYQRDFVLAKGILIHINPSLLARVYDLLYRSTRRYICVVEYYNPTPVEVVYRGHKERLFKRDFAGEVLDAHSDLRLVDYGFVYHRDPSFPQDDFTWFLIEKAGGEVAG